MNFSRWNRLGTLLSFVAIFWMALAPVAACACGIGGAAQAATAIVMVCPCCVKTGNHPAKHHAAKTSCHCETATAVVSVALDTHAHSVRFDVSALVTAPVAALRAPVWVSCDFALPIHGPPQLLVARRFASRAPPAC